MTAARRARLRVEPLEDRVTPAAEPTFRGGLTVAAADLTGDGLPDLVAGPGPGFAPRVTVTDGLTGEVVAAFDAFEPTFLGGVFVAVGDVTGDGRPEVVVGAGEGGGPRVAVFDPRTGRRLSEFLAYDAAFRGGVRVAVPAGVGQPIVTGAGPGGGPHVRIVDATGAPAFVTGVPRDFLAYEPDFRGGVAVAAGDVDGDGLFDVITAPGAGGAPLVRVFTGATDGPDKSFFAFDPAARGGAWVAAGDVDGNGLDDVVVGAGDGADPLVRVFAGGTPFAEWAAYEARFRGGVRVAAADVNGDAFADVLTGPEGGGGPRVTSWDGYQFTQTASFFAVTDPGAAGFASDGGPAPVPHFEGGLLLSPPGPAGSANLSASLLRRFSQVGGEVGLFPVDDPGGGIRQADGRLLYPHQPGYAALALAAGRRVTVFDAGATPGATAALAVAEKVLFGVYWIRGGTAAEWEARNPTNDPAGGPVALFRFLDQYRVGPWNRVAFEAGDGGDADFNDLIVGFRGVGDTTPQPNTPPAVSPIPTQHVPAGTPTGPIPFVVTDAQNAGAYLTVFAGTDGGALVTLGGSGENRTVDVAPIGLFVGPVHVTLRVRDLGGLDTVETFAVVFEAPP